jgi:hypothetical protein
MKEQTNKGKYYCLLCREHSHTPQHDLCYEFRLFQIKDQQEKLSKAWDMLQRAYEVIDDYHCTHLTIEHHSTTDIEIQ